jgi:hypothetical protein
MSKKFKWLLGVLAMVVVPLAVYAAVAPGSLRHIDTPSDEECLTYESANNAFEWQSCTTTPVAGDFTLENSEFIDNGTDGTINFGRDDSGTVTLGSLDNDTTAALTINPGGVTTLTLGGSTDTVTTGADSGLTLANSETVDSDTDGAIVLGRNDTGTVTLTAKDDDATADFIIDAGGTGTLTLGSSADTVTVGATTGLTLANSESVNTGAQATFDFTRNDAGVVTLTCSDNDATAGCVYDAGGASPIQVGSADVTAITNVTDDTGDAEEVHAVNSVGPADVVGFYKELIFCGQNAENGTIYDGPLTATFYGDGADATLGVAACDALDNATEGDADTSISTLATKIHGMWCRSNATLGGGETIDVTLRTAEGDAVTTDGAASTITCQMAAGVTECRVNTGTTTNIGANATLAIKVVEVSNNADVDEIWCSVLVSFP